MAGNSSVGAFGVLLLGSGRGSLYWTVSYLNPVAVNPRRAFQFIIYDRSLAQQKSARCVYRVLMRVIILIARELENCLRSKLTIGRGWP